EDEVWGAAGIEHGCPSCPFLSPLTSYLLPFCNPPPEYRMSEPRMTPLATWREYPEAEMVQRAESFHEELSRRRTVRQFSDRAVPRAVIEACLRAAGTAPSGANLQPWHFVV